MKPDPPLGNIACNGKRCPAAVADCLVLGNVRARTPTGCKIIAEGPQHIMVDIKHNGHSGEVGSTGHGSAARNGPNDYRRGITQHLEIVRAGRGGLSGAVGYCKPEGIRGVLQALNRQRNPGPPLGKIER